jgi:hypothetical protein
LFTVPKAVNDFRGDIAGEGGVVMGVGFVGGFAVNSFFENKR